MVSASSFSRVQHEALRSSKLYRDYEKAFTEATGLPLQLQPVGAWNLAHHGHANENPFCELIAQSGPGCAACLEMQARLETGPSGQSQSAICPAGLCDTVVPVVVNGETVAFLHTGQIFQKRPTEADFARAVIRFQRWKIDLAKDEYRTAFFASPVMPAVRHRAVIQLLTIFAVQLSQSATRLLLASQKTEPAQVQAAKAWVAAKYAEDCSLAVMARVVHMNAFSFCRQFKKATNVNFVEFLNRTRIQEAQKRLQKPEGRINEIALEVGFSSLPHFNRVFKRVVGYSPTEYRRSLTTSPIVRKKRSTTARPRSAATS